MAWHPGLGCLVLLVPLLSRQSFGNSGLQFI
jgi:hypothetical protein